jgi:transmembrane sensor
MLYTASGVAASLLIVLALSFMGTFQKGSEVLVSMSADYGNRSEIMLPDGSLVKLNAGSEVVYSYDPKKKTREVDFAKNSNFRLTHYYFFSKSFSSHE